MTSSITQDKGWIPWSGGDRPHPPKTYVEIKRRSGVIQTGQSAFAFWMHDPEDHLNDIIAYRLAASPVPAPDGRDAEIERLKARVAELEAGLRTLFKSNDRAVAAIQARPQDTVRIAQKMGEEFADVLEAARALLTQVQK